MNELPDFLPVRIAHEHAKVSRSRLSRLDRLVVVVPPKATESHFAGLPQGKQLSRITADARRQEAPLASTRIDNERATVLTVAPCPGGSAFERLVWARRAIADAMSDGPRALGIVIRGIDEADRAAIVDALSSAVQAAAFELPTFKSKRKRARRLASLVFLEAADAAQPRASRAASLGNNLARWLTAQPPNLLDAARYRAIIEQIAKDHGLGHEFLDEKKLHELGAGAFLAVAQGNAERDAGIVHLSYSPKASIGAESSGERLGIVGKGILFDTGGINLKPFKAMLEMHTDMQGSAVALGTLVALASLEVPYSIDAWLPVTANAISARAYKSQDVVTAANGTTIQVIHTDAEGRMVLADALTLAAREKPDLLIDFATLTGTCVSALTSRYSGVFTNRAGAHPALIAAGARSGERVWPFPLDEDFEEMISSKIADVRQCAVEGAGDHIAAATFLSKFVPRAVPWIHVDMSSSQHKGGLGHIPSDITGFGIRFALELLDAGTGPGARPALADALES